MTSCRTVGYINQNISDTYKPRIHMATVIGHIPHVECTTCSFPVCSHSACHDRDCASVACKRRQRPLHSVRTGRKLCHGMRRARQDMRTPRGHWKLDCHLSGTISGHGHMGGPRVMVECAFTCLPFFSMSVTSFYCCPSASCITIASRGRSQHTRCFSFPRATGGCVQCVLANLVRVY